MEQKTFGVLGLGLFGAALARTLTQEGHDVIIMDKLMDHVEEMIDIVEQAVQGDFTKIENLKEAGIDTCDIVIIATSSQLEDTIVALLHLKKMGVPHIIVKTKNMTYREVLLKLGADQVILPETEMGVRIGRELANPSFGQLAELNKEYAMGLIQVQPDWIGHTLRELDLRSTYGINILAIKTGSDQRHTMEFSPDYILKDGDALIAISQEDDFTDQFIS